MSLSASKRFWGCLNCRNRKNDLAKDLKCRSCSTARPKQRQVIVLRDGQEIYLCKAITAASIPTVTVFREAPFPQVQLKIVLPIISNDLTECIIEAISSSHIADYGIPVDSPSLSPSSPPPLVSPSQRTATGSGSKKAAFGNNSPEAHKENNNNSNSNSNSSDAKSISSTEKKKKEKKGDTLIISSSVIHTHIDKGRNVEAFSLFDKILDDATKEVYDLRIGRYINSDTLTGSQDEVGNIKQRNYVHFMERESQGMKKIVNHVIAERSYEFSINNLLGPDNQPQRLPRDKTPCPLCEFNYPKEELLGLISFKTVMNWRAERGVPIDAKDPRGSKFNVHNAVRICVFCNQMFDKEFGDVIDDQLSVTHSIESESLIKGALSCSNTVYKKIVKKMIEKQKSNENRPLSRIRQGLAIEKLRMKADSSPAPRPSSSDPSMYRPSSNFLREKYSSAQALLFEKKKFEVEARKTNHNIEKIERRLYSGKKKGQQSANSSPYDRKALSQGSNRPRNKFDKESRSRDRIRSKSAQILREKAANRVHPSRRKKNSAFLTSGGGSEIGSETGSELGGGSVSSRASSRASISSARSVKSNASSSVGSRRSRNSRDSRHKRALSADHADNRIGRGGGKGREGGGGGRGRGQGGANQSSSSAARKLRFTPTKHDNSTQSPHKSNTNNNNSTDKNNISNSNRDSKSRAASRGREISLDTIVESERNLPKISNPEKPRKPLLLIVKKVKVGDPSDPNAAASMDGTLTFTSANNNINNNNNNNININSSVSVSVVRRIELPVVIPVKPNLVSSQSMLLPSSSSSSSSSSVQIPLPPEGHEKSSTPKKSHKLLPISTSHDNNFNSNNNRNANLSSSSSSVGNGQQKPIAQSPSNQSQKSVASNISQSSSKNSKHSTNSKSRGKNSKSRGKKSSKIGLPSSSSSSSSSSPAKQLFNEPQYIGGDKSGLYSNNNNSSSSSSSPLRKPSSLQTESPEVLKPKNIAEATLLSKFMSVSKFNNNSSSSSSIVDKGGSNKQPHPDGDSNYYYDDDFETFTNTKTLTHIPIVIQNSRVDFGNGNDEGEEEEEVHDFNWGIDDVTKKDSFNFKNKKMKSPNHLSQRVEEEDAVQISEEEEEDGEGGMVAEEPRTGGLDEYAWPNSGDYKESVYKDDWILTPPSSSSMTSSTTAGGGGGGRLLTREGLTSRGSSRSSSRQASMQHSRVDAADLRVLSRGIKTPTETKQRQRVNTPGETHFIEVIKPKSAALLPGGGVGGVGVGGSSSRLSSLTHQKALDAAIEEMTREGYNNNIELEDEVTVLGGQIKVLVDKGISSSTTRYKTTAQRLDYLKDLLDRYNNANLSIRGFDNIHEGKHQHQRMMSKVDAEFAELPTYSNNNNNNNNSSNNNGSRGSRGKKKGGSSSSSSAFGNSNSNNNKILYGVAIKSHPYLRDGGGGGGNSSNSGKGKK